MQYMALIYDTESTMRTMSPDEQKTFMAEYEEFTRQLREAGKLVAGDALKPVETATTVRVRDGQTMITDGPFAETREQLGGYYLMECEDLDEALAWAAKIPSAKHGSIEVRPLMVW
ncbi:MAG: YciI family protein [Thermoleophilia bacterium]|nr:YciI family protein [Myxococcales bacterium]MCB0874510.1 YciI family protein [Thermoleophilia bacterium]MCB9716002.1 YciI family protein [Myxococcales bacterium]